MRAVKEKRRIYFAFLRCLSVTCVLARAFQGSLNCLYLRRFSIHGASTSVARRFFAYQVFQNNASVLIVAFVENAKIVQGKGIL